MSNFRDGIRYEVALEILGQRLQPLLVAIEEERKKANPSVAFIEYCETRIGAIGDLQEDLLPSEKEIIDLILDPNSEFKVN